MTAARGTLRVMSYNLKSLELDEAAAVRVIAAADPDVVCLQETVRWLFGPWRMRRFARRLGMIAVVNTFAARGTGILVREDCARATYPRVTLARGVALDGRVRRLRRSWPTPRGYAELRVRLSEDPADEIAILSVHMSIVPAERARHLPMLRSAIASIGADRLVLAGDLNERPGGTVWQSLVPPLRDAAPGERTPTFPAVGAVHRIDAFLVGDRVVVTGYEVVAGPDVERGSDHRPVVATFALA